MQGTCRPRAADPDALADARFTMLILVYLLTRRADRRRAEADSDALTRSTLKLTPADADGLADADALAEARALTDSDADAEGRTYAQTHLPAQSMPGSDTGSSDAPSSCARF